MSVMRMIHLTWQTQELVVYLNISENLKPYSKWLLGATLAVTVCMDLHGRNIGSIPWGNEGHIEGEDLLQGPDQNSN
jgi:hypothetical protein